MARRFISHIPYAELWKFTNALLHNINLALTIFEEEKSLIFPSRYGFSIYANIEQRWQVHGLWQLDIDKTGLS